MSLTKSHQYNVLHSGLNLDKPNRVERLLTSKNWTPIAQILSILAFVSACWVVHRSLQVRTDCLRSPTVAAIFVGERRILNCKYQSRLNLSSLFDPLPYHVTQQLRSLEVADPLISVLPSQVAPFAVDIDHQNPRSFELSAKRLRLGSAWLQHSKQVRRALTLAWLNTQFPEKYKDSFHRELIADLVSLMVYREDPWTDKGQSILGLLRFPVAAATLDSYCRSPFRSIAHGPECTGERNQTFEAKWGFRPLLAAALNAIIERQPVTQQLVIFNKLRQGVEPPILPVIGESRAGNLVHWFQTALPAYLAGLGMDLQDETVAVALKQVYKRLEIDAPVRWELTVDVTHTPVWKEILEQLKKRNQYRPNERTLVFTPEGPVAFPGAFPVAWDAEDIRSQKHVMIACTWPGRQQTPDVSARQIFAEQSCQPLTRAFWD